MLVRGRCVLRAALAIRGKMSQVDLVAGSESGEERSALPGNGEGEGMGWVARAGRMVIRCLGLEGHH